MDPLPLPSTLPLSVPARLQQSSVSACGFITPPLTGEFSVPQLYDWHYENNKGHSVFIHGSDSSPVTFADFIPAAHLAGRYVTRATTTSDDVDFNRITRSVVAIFAASDTITYFTTLIGMFRAGIPAFPITPRFSAVVVAHLLVKSKVSHIMVGEEDSLHEIVGDAVQKLKDAGEVVPTVCRMPQFDDIYQPQAEVECLPPWNYDWDHPALIIHSSGSTGYPKPIIWTHRMALQYSLRPWQGDRDFTGQVFAAHALELFHAMGLHFALFVASAGITLATFSPASPATRPTLDGVFRALLDSKPDFVLAPPVYIAGWSMDSDKMNFLSKRRGILYGGRFLDKDVGSRLADHGVQIYTIYGTTETGMLNIMLPKPVLHDWEYFEVNPHVVLTIVRNIDDTYELIFLERDVQAIGVTNTYLDGQNGYSNGDLFQVHPQKPHFFKGIGRTDEQVMLSTGEVINPSSFEEYVSQDSEITGAVIFGRGRSLPGIIVEPVVGIKTGTRLETHIWSKIEEANRLNPKQPPIPQEMIIVATAEKPFTFSGKGLPQRTAILKKYESEIEALYEAMAARLYPATPIVAL
ncbi:hypothetical protein B0H16DRAFT_1586710 [Mycena metata]|uniref:AMP-dependent synthetase/ligase domain-containing protein n=1 Tax=Mycena metata TaxID=1033252 RepID=A0AAD7HVZ3_9AGAR|nr:hypothetical protein B0H16DRAFT_1586683 [Mycena metata]KAJ7729608.1 hypothetical protein B0H16DRAFT_1586710 [Mycena metata]